ncbi:MAG: hypothetical protein VX642_04285 [Bdellovibrionota bacterium]|nr:hypothetical protein [Bdellovibrionota bacterium]
MSVMDYLFISTNVFALIGVGVIWFRMNRPAKEDPRLSKGLQLLQSKISVLEDLSDRTDNQVKQMLRLIENKGAQVQETIFTAKETIFLLEQSMAKSIELAEVFEDKIPHEEIIERQSSKKYIEAAKLAHEGYSAEEIAKRVDLDIAEIEFIAKVNKDRLMFSEKDLPNWAQNKAQSDVSFSQAKQELINKRTHQDSDFGDRFEETFKNPEVSMDRLAELGQQFRSACEEVEKEDAKKAEFANKIKSGMSSAVQSVFQPLEEVKSVIRSELNELSTKNDKEYDGDADWDDFISSNDEVGEIFREQLAEQNQQISEEDLSFEDFDADDTTEFSQNTNSTQSIDKAMDRINAQEEESTKLPNNIEFVEENQGELRTTETPLSEEQKEQELKKLMQQPVVSSSMFADPEMNQALDEIDPLSFGKKEDTYKISHPSTYGKVETKEDQQAWDLVNKAPKKSTEATITGATSQQKPKFQMDLVSKIRERQNERKKLGQVRSKIRSSDEISSMSSLDFPDIKPNPNDHLG